MEALIGVIGILIFAVVWVMFGKFVWPKLVDKLYEKHSREVEQELCDEYEAKHGDNNDER